MTATRKQFQIQTKTHLKFIKNKQHRIGARWGEQGGALTHPGNIK